MTNHNDGPTEPPSPPDSNEFPVLKTFLGRSPRVLVVEDNDIIREAVARWFESKGWQVIDAEDGSAFYALVEGIISGDDPSSVVDCIITDVAMPGIDSLSILEGLRASGFRHPIVVFSGLGKEELPERVQKLGGAVFLEKPVDVFELYQQVSEMVRGAIDDRTVH